MLKCVVGERKRKYQIRKKLFLAEIRHKRTKVDADRWKKYWAEKHQMFKNKATRVDELEVKNEDLSLQLEGFLKRGQGFVSKEEHHRVLLAKKDSDRYKFDAVQDLARLRKERDEFRVQLLNAEQELAQANKACEIEQVKQASVSQRNLEEAERQWQLHVDTLEGRIQDMTEQIDLLRAHRQEDDLWLPSAPDLFEDNRELRVQLQQKDDRIDALEGNMRRLSRQLQGQGRTLSTIANERQGPAPEHAEPS
jgi:hypothetical protein